MYHKKIGCPLYESGIESAGACDGEESSGCALSVHLVCHGPDCIIAPGLIAERPPPRYPAIAPTAQDYSHDALQIL